MSLTWVVRCFWIATNNDIDGTDMCSILLHTGSSSSCHIISWNWNDPSSSMSILNNGCTKSLRKSAYNHRSKVTFVLPVSRHLFANHVEAKICECLGNKPTEVIPPNNIRAQQSTFEKLNFELFHSKSVRKNICGHDDDDVADDGREFDSRHWLSRENIFFTTLRFQDWRTRALMMTMMVADDGADHDDGSLASRSVRPWWNHQIPSELWS